jgi:hypothetical protein
MLWLATPFDGDVSSLLATGSGFASVSSFLASSSRSTCSPLAARLWYFFASCQHFFNIQSCKQRCDGKPCILPTHHPTNSATPSHPRPPRVTNCRPSCCAILFVCSKHKRVGQKSSQVKSQAQQHVKFARVNRRFPSPKSLGQLASAAGLHREKLQTTLVPKLRGIELLAKKKPSLHTTTQHTLHTHNGRG